MTETGSRPLGLQHQPLRQVVFDDLRRRIIEGEFEQGERLFEDQLALELDVSRNPVREALQALAQDGFVELEPRRGARVAVISPERARELFEVREPLEGLVAKLAAQRRTEAQVAQLQQLVDDGLGAIASGDLGLLPALNTEYHRVMRVAAANSFLDDTLERLAHIIQWVYSKHISLRGTESWWEHELIVDAVTRQDADTAFERASEHIAKARAAYVGFDDTPTD